MSRILQKLLDEIFDILQDLKKATHEVGSELDDTNIKFQRHKRPAEETLESTETIDYSWGEYFYNGMIFNDFNFLPIITYILLIVSIMCLFPKSYSSHKQEIIDNRSLYTKKKMEEYLASLKVISSCYKSYNILKYILLIKLMFLWVITTGLCGPNFNIINSANDFWFLFLFSIVSTISYVILVLGLEYSRGLFLFLLILLVFWKIPNILYHPLSKVQLLLALPVLYLVFVSPLKNLYIKMK